MNWGCHIGMQFIAMLNVHTHNTELILTRYHFVMKLHSPVLVESGEARVHFQELRVIH